MQGLLEENMTHIIMPDIMATKRKASVLERDPKRLSSFLDWCRRYEVQLSPSIAITEHDVCAQYGMLAKANIDVEETLFIIPRSALLNPTTTSIADLLVKDEEKLVGSSGWVPILISLIHEYTSPNSKWKEYFALVPDFGELDLPMFWPKPILSKYLRNTGVMKAVNADSKHIEQDFYQYIRPFVRRNSQVISQRCDDLVLYKKMVAFVMAYSFTEPEDDEDTSDEDSSDDERDVLTLEAKLKEERRATATNGNHDHHLVTTNGTDEEGGVTTDAMEYEEEGVTTEVMDDDSDMEVTVVSDVKEKEGFLEGMDIRIGLAVREKRAIEKELSVQLRMEEFKKGADSKEFIKSDCDSVDDGEKIFPMMVPVADILNHIADNNAKLQFDVDNLKMVATKKIKAGEEIFNTYGELPNWQLLQMYGFTQHPDYNHYDVLDIPLNLLQNFYDDRTEYITLTITDEFVVGQDGIICNGVDVQKILMLYTMPREEFDTYREMVDREELEECPEDLLPWSEIKLQSDSYKKILHLLATRMKLTLPDDTPLNHYEQDPRCRYAGYLVHGQHRILERLLEASTVVGSTTLASDTVSSSTDVPPVWVMPDTDTKRQ